MRDHAPTLYLCGGISVNPDNYRDAFADAEIALLRAGYDTRSPLRNGVLESDPWLDHMKADVHMLVECDGVATIPGWEQGRGTRVEVQLAWGLGIPVRPVSEWVAA